MLGTEYNPRNARHREAIRKFKELRVRDEAVALRDRLASMEVQAEAILNVYRGKPPQFAEFLLSLLAPKNSVESQLGDMQEVFEDQVKRFGLGRAGMFYWTQVLRAIWPNVFSKLKNWGFIGTIVELGRTKLGL